MAEAVVASQDFAFLELAIEKLTVVNAVSNTGSKFIKQRCGAKKIDRVPAKYLSDD